MGLYGGPYGGPLWVCKGAPEGPFKRELKGSVGGEAKAALELRRHLKRPAAGNEEGDTTVLVSPL